MITHNSKCIIMVEQIKHKNDKFFFNGVRLIIKNQNQFEIVIFNKSIYNGMLYKVNSILNQVVLMIRKNVKKNSSMV